MGPKRGESRVRSPIRKTLVPIGGHEALRIEIQIEGRMPSELTTAEAEVAALVLLGLTDRQTTSHNSCRSPKPTGSGA